MKLIVDEMQNYRLFSTLRPNVIVKLFHYMEKVEYPRGYTVFSEGVSKTDAVYFIKEGEFAVTKAAHASNKIEDLELEDTSAQELPI